MTGYLDTNPLKFLSDESIEKLRMLEECKDLDFQIAVEILGLDPAKDFRFADLSRVNLDGVDTTAFDFYGSDLGKSVSPLFPQVLGRKTVEFFVESAVVPKLQELLLGADISGYSMLPVVAGSGRSGEWSRTGQVSSRASGMAVVTCVIHPELVDDIVEDVLGELSAHIGAVCIVDSEEIVGAKAAR